MPVKKIFKQFKQFKQNVFSKELTFPEAKVLAMVAVIYSDEKTDLKREMGLLEALCAFDKRLFGMDIPSYIQGFQSYQNNLDTLFGKLEESIDIRDDKMDLLSSAYLLASIDGSVSKEETQILNRLGTSLRLTLEDINTVKEHTEHITKTLSTNHRIGGGKQTVDSDQISLAEAKILAMLAVIHSDGKQEDGRELSLLATLCSFGNESGDLDLEFIQKRFQEYQNNLDPLLHILSDLKIEQEAQIDLLSSAFLLAGIDSDISKEEARTLVRLSEAFNLNDEAIETAKNRAQALIDTMKELRVLS